MYNVSPIWGQQRKANIMRPLKDLNSHLMSRKPKALNNCKIKSPVSIE